MLLDKDSRALAEAMAELLDIQKSGKSEGNSNNSRLYGIFDSALIKGLWLELDTGNLSYLPLYDGDHEKIAEAIPYVIHLDYINQYEACVELLSHIGKNALLLMQSDAGLAALTDKLRYFYHVELPNGKAGLRRYFDSRFFSGFIANLNADTREKLFNEIRYFAIENNQCAEDNKRFVDFYWRTELTLEIEQKEILLTAKQTNDAD